MGRVKGSTLLGAVKFLRSRRDDAAARLAPAQQHYLDERIKSSAWYPLEDLLVLVRACADLLGTSHGQAFEYMGEFGAKAHAETYGDLMKGGGSNSRTFALWSTQFDAGKMRRTIEGPGRMRVELQEFKAPEAALCKLIGGYIKGTIELNPVSDVVVDKLSCTLAGDDTCSWRASWKREER